MLNRKWHAMLASSQFVVFGVAALLLIALLLRTINLDAITSMNSDEYSWMLAGTSLVETGIPTSWTISWPFSDYSVFDDTHWEIIGRKRYWVVTPWLDHPPLFSLMTAGWLHVIPDMSVRTPIWSAVRVPMIGISIATMGCTFLFARRLFGNHIAWATLAAYTFFPAAILSSRFVLAENAIALWLIAGLLVTHIFIEGPYRGKWVFMGMVLLSFTAPLLKLSGAIVPASIALILFLSKKYRSSFYIVLSALLSGITVLFYGWSHNWAAFLEANKIHATRPQNITNMWSLFTDVTNAYAPLFDPSIVVGFIGLILLIAYKHHNKVEVFLGAPLFTYISMLLLVAPRTGYSWYKFPLYSLLAIGLGYMVSSFLKNRKFMVILTMPLVLYAIQEGFDLKGSVLKVVALVTLSTGLLLFLDVLPRSKRVFISVTIIGFLFFAQTNWMIGLLSRY